MTTDSRSTRPWGVLRLLGAACVVVTSSVAALVAQSSELPSTDFVFEVASVKPAQGSGGTRFELMPSGRVTVTNMTLRRLILRAYALQEYQLIDAPDWTASERFDIVATGKLAPQSDRRQQLMAGLRNLLRDRFRLVLRMDTREQEVYKLVFARDDKSLGRHIKAATTDCDAYWERQTETSTAPAAARLSGSHCGMRFRVRATAATLDLGAMTMKQIAEALSNQVDRSVLDQTGLMGRFDLELTYKPDFLLRLHPPPGVAHAPNDLEAPRLLVALEEQAGLKLEAGRGAVPVRVVDHVERPRPN